MSKTKKKGSSKETFDKKKFLANLDLSCCVFCNTREDSGVCGKKISKHGLTVHYFCMLFSSGLSQNGHSQEDGILGFLPNDIIVEVRRGTKLKCSFCKTKGATIGCVVGACRKVFHFGCGQAYNTLHQYFGNFSSFCEDHRPRQMIPVDRLSLCGKSNATCAICMTAVSSDVMSNDTIRAPCCGYAWFHRDCIQKHATTAGLYFFKCPLCNNKDVFQDEMLHFGIFIPEQDAAWELEPGAYNDLLQRYMKCDSARCKCPYGRQYHKDGGKWEVLVCDWCGAQGTHIECRNLHKIRDDYVCNECKELDDKYKSKRKPFKPAQKRSRGKYGENAKTAENTRQFQEKFQKTSPGGGLPTASSPDQNLPSTSTSSQSLPCVSTAVQKKSPSASKSTYGRKRSRSRKDLLRSSETLLHLYYDETDEELEVVDSSQDKEAKCDRDSKMDQIKSRSMSPPKKDRSTSPPKKDRSKVYRTRSSGRMSPLIFERTLEVHTQRRSRSAGVGNRSNKRSVETCTSEKMSKEGKNEQRKTDRKTNSGHTGDLFNKHKYSKMYRRTPMLTAYIKRKRRRRPKDKEPIAVEDGKDKEPIAVEDGQGNGAVTAEIQHEGEAESNELDTECETETEGEEMSIDVSLVLPSEGGHNESTENVVCSKENESGAEVSDVQEKRRGKSRSSERSTKRRRTDPSMAGYVRRRLSKNRTHTAQRYGKMNIESKGELETDTEEEGTIFTGIKDSSLDDSIEVVDITLGDGTSSIDTNLDDSPWPGSLDTELPVLERQCEVLNGTVEFLDQAPVLDPQTDTVEVIERQTDTSDESSEDDVPLPRTRSGRRMFLKNRKRKCKKIKKKQEENDCQSEYGYVTTDYEVDSETEEEDYGMEVASNDKNQLDSNDLAKEDEKETVSEKAEEMESNHIYDEKASSERRGRSRRRSRSVRRSRSRERDTESKNSGTLELTAAKDSHSRSRSKFRKRSEVTSEEEVSFRGMMTRSRSRSRTRCKISMMERLSFYEDSPSIVNNPTDVQMNENFDEESSEDGMNDDSNDEETVHESHWSESEAEEVQKAIEGEEDIQNKLNECFSSNLGENNSATFVSTKSRSPSKRVGKSIGDTVKLRYCVKGINKRNPSPTSKVSVMPLFTNIDCNQENSTDHPMETAQEKPIKGGNKIHDFGKAYKLVEGKKGTYRYYVTTQERYALMSPEEKSQYKARVTLMRKRREMLKRLADIKGSNMTPIEKKRYLKIERDLVAKDVIEKRLCPGSTKRNIMSQSLSTPENDLNNGDCSVVCKTTSEVSPQSKLKRLLMHGMSSDNTTVSSDETFQTSSIREVLSNDIHSKEFGRDNTVDPFDFNEYEREYEEETLLKSIKYSPSRKYKMTTGSGHEDSSEVDEGEGEILSSNSGIRVSSGNTSLENSAVAQTPKRIKSKDKKIKTFLSDDNFDNGENLVFENDVYSGSTRLNYDVGTPGKKSRLSKGKIGKPEGKRRPGRPPGALSRTTIMRLKSKQRALDRRRGRSKKEHAVNEESKKSHNEISEDGKIDELSEPEGAQEYSSMSRYCLNTDPEQQTDTGNFSTEASPLSTSDVANEEQRDGVSHNQGIRTPSKRHLGMKKPKGFLMRTGFRCLSKDDINLGFINRVLYLLNKPVNETPLSFVELVNSYLPLQQSISTGQNCSLREIARKYNSPLEKTRKLRSAEKAKRSPWKLKTRTPKSASKISTRKSFSSVENRRAKSEMKRSSSKSRSQERFEEICSSSAKKALDFNEKGEMFEVDQSSGALPNFNDLLNIDTEIAVESTQSIISPALEQYLTPRSKKHRGRPKKKDRKSHISERKSISDPSNEETAKSNINKSNTNECVISEVQAVVASNALLCLNYGGSSDPSFNLNQTDENMSSAETYSCDGDSLSQGDMDTDEACDVAVSACESTPVRSEGKGQSTNHSEIGVRKSPLFEIL